MHWWSFFDQLRVLWTTNKDDKFPGDFVQASETPLRNSRISFRILNNKVCTI